jgi:hypothetical protein
MAIKVKQSTIDEIKKMGMTKALAAAKTRRTPEYQEAIKRMYGAKRLAKATAGSKTTRGSSIPAGGVMGSKRSKVMAGPVKSTLKKTAVKRNAAGKVVKRQSFADLTPAQQKAVTAKMKADRSKTSRTIGRVVGAVAAPFGPVGAAAAVYGTRDVRKRKKK